MLKILLSLFLLAFIVSPAYAGWLQTPVNQPYKYNLITTAATTVVKASPAILHTITVTGGTAGTIIVYDNASTAASPVANFSSTNALATYTFDIAMASGCTVVTGSATNLTVSYL